MNLSEYLAREQQRIEREMERLVPSEATPPETIHRAMRYSLFAGGKRIRPILCLAAAEAIADAVPGAETAACSLEFIHTYSLIHDDLPALDNDDYRRGKLDLPQSLRRRHGDSGGRRLLTLAFETLAKMDAVPADRKSASSRSWPPHPARWAA